MNEVKKIAEKDALIARQAAEILLLQARIAWLERQKFGPKSERQPLDDPNQLSLNLELEESPAVAAEPETEEITYQRKKASKKHPGRHPLPEYLPRTEIIIEPEEDTTDMKCIGQEETEVLAKVPAVLFVIRYIRKKYVSQDEKILMGPLPSRAILKGIADESLLADIIVSKYLDHLPLYRQIERLKRQEVTIASSTMSDWVAQTARLLKPLYEALRTSVTQYAAYIQADESPIKVLDKKKQGKSHQGYMWVYRDPGDKLVLFNYRKGRGREGPKEMLQQEYPKVLPKNAIGKAIAYSLKRWTKLSEYVYFGLGEIDNNLIENQIRPLALGRKNYLFAGSHAAAQNTAILYSILLSAKQNKLNPYRYLYTLLKRVPDYPINKIAELLPHNFVGEEYEGEVLIRGSWTDGYTKTGAFKTIKNLHNLGNAKYPLISNVNCHTLQ